MDAAESNIVAELLAHDAWLRRIVVDLVEPDAVDDVIQQTWAAALVRPPTDNPRGWLRRVARNLAARWRRSEARRRQREQLAARSESVPSTDAMLDRLAAHRAVAATVESLDEPYRTAVLLRYFEDLPPRDIAEHLGVSGSTVRTRIDRGLAKVRQRVRDADLRALAVWVFGGREPTPLGVNGGLRASAVAKAAVAVVMLAAVGAAWWTASGDAAPSVRPVVARPDGASSARGVPPPDRAVAREAVPTRSAERPNGRGLAVDTAGLPLAGVPILRVPAAGATVLAPSLDIAPADLSGLSPVARTDSSGRFDVLLGGGRWLVGDGWLNLRAFSPGPDDEREALIVAERPASLRGRMVDSEGVGLDGVLVVARCAGLSRLDRPHDHTDSFALGEAVSDQHGEFELASVPAIPELELIVAKTGYESKVVRDVDFGGGLSVTLARPLAGRFSVAGRVLDELGQPAAGATIRLGQRTARTSAEGTFEVEARFVSKTSRLVISKPGHVTVERSELVARLLDGSPRLSGVVVRLGSTPLELNGRVVDAAGGPLADVVVVVWDATALAGGVTTFEDLARGVEPRVESIAGVPLKADARSDARGRFAIGGLADRPYRLRLFDPRRLASVTTEPIRPGAAALNVELVADVLPELRGVVRSRTGRPLPQVDVWVRLCTFDRAGTRLCGAGAHTETDEHGRFVLRDVPRGDTELGLSGAGIGGFRYPLAGARGDRELVLEPFAECSFRVEAAGDADAFVLEDEQRARLTVAEARGPLRIGRDEWELRDGRSPVLVASELARWLVLLKAGTELRRVPIVLAPDRLTTIRP